MNESIVVRQATINELKEAAALFNKYRMFYNQESDIEGAENFIQERLQRNESILFLATVDGRTIGFTQLYPSFSSVSMKKAWILNDLFVEEEFRRQGVAECLLDSVKQFAENTSAATIRLATAKDNVPARRLYEQNGYERDEAFYHYHLKL